MHRTRSLTTRSLYEAPVEALHKMPRVSKQSRRSSPAPCMQQHKFKFMAPSAARVGEATNRPEEYVPPESVLVIMSCLEHEAASASSGPCMSSFASDAVQRQRWYQALCAPVWLLRSGRHQQPTTLMA